MKETQKTSPSNPHSVHISATRIGAEPPPREEAIQLTRAVAISDFKRLLAPLVTWLAVRCEDAIDPTACKINSAEHPSKKLYLAFYMKTLGRTVTGIAQTEPLYALVRANHGSGKALRQPMKFSFEQAFGGPGDRITAISRLVVSVPKKANLADCRVQADCLLKYLLRDNWDISSWHYDKQLEVVNGNLALTPPLLDDVKVEIRNETLSEKIRRAVARA